ncbi:cartilage acidic protein 1-like isoform X2 [Ruditapes philippinarum]|uniref:cartilage acidic protein 1-like isoform X2 n=1 Tax=Ruditapes philippinarum TaxID=129788 RepID=UPI00295BA34C|nr:cartilage acidic protein 1-like isoform X2 [Ruditapes philippinarum]
MHAFSTTLCIFFVFINHNNGIFVKENWLDGIKTNQKNYGVAVSDVNHDGNPDFIVAGYDGANFVFTYDKTTGTVTNIAQDNTPFARLRDVPGAAIGVAACDIDGDGKEEIYFLNTNQAYAGRAAYGDKIFKWRDNRYVDLYSDTVNYNMPAKGFAGRSVACVDRRGSGKYSFVLATYSAYGEGQFALIEMDESHPENDINTGRIVLKNVGGPAGIARSTGGRGIVVGPILGNNGRSDIFFGNEGNSGLRNAGANYLFMNKGDGTFTDIAGAAGIADADENVRGIALADFNRDGKIDIAYGNWNGPHRLFLQKRNKDSVTFTNFASSNANYSMPSLIRTVIAADFDNDGVMEVLHNNIYSRGRLQPNKLFKIVPDGKGVKIQDLDIGDALEENGYGTGGAVTDFNGDGKLEVMLSHGEGNSQPLSIFTVSTGAGNNWIRIQPRTKFGAPARGSAVKVTTQSGTIHLHVIDGGSGYLCEMEPYAHIGLGKEIPKELSIQWPDGTTISKALTSADLNKVHIVDYKSKAPNDKVSDKSNQSGPKVCPIGTCDDKSVEKMLKYAEETGSAQHLAPSCFLFVLHIVCLCWLF